jgi:hypothetical protein
MLVSIGSKEHQVALLIIPNRPQRFVKPKNKPLPITQGT